MEKRTFTTHLILSGVLGLAIVLSALTTRGHLDPRPPVARTLPAYLTSYQTREVLYCQEPDCTGSLVREQTTEPARCPTCGGNMDASALAEKELLPSDTVIDRRLYVSSSGRHFTVSIVHGGYERRSIHKPQVCLVAQGYAITRQQRIEVPLPQDGSLDVTAMEMNGGSHLFAYWFTDGKRVTGSHFARLFAIAWDGVVHNTRRRWAYISIITPRPSDDMGGLKRLIRDLYPHVSHQGAAAPARTHEPEPQATGKES